MYMHGSKKNTFIGLQNAELQKDPITKLKVEITGSHPSITAYHSHGIGKSVSKTEDAKLEDIGGFSMESRFGEW